MDQTVENMGKLITTLGNAIQDDIRSRTSDDVQVIREKYSYFKKDMDPESFHAVIGYEQQNIIDSTMESYFPEMLESRKIRSAYLCWNDIYRLAGNLVSTIHGSSVCCMDCSRWIANCYIKYCKNGTLPDMTITEKTYWKPDFGTAEEWMDYADSVVKLHHGQPMDFITYTQAFIAKYKK